MLCILPSRALIGADLDLSGRWESSEFGELELRQSGNKVIAKQKSPNIAALLGENMFLGELSGNVIKGKIATVLEVGDKEFCGKNWASWVDFELKMSSDGNRLEGKWLKGRHNISKKGCLLTGSSWETFKLTRTPTSIEFEPVPPIAEEPMNKGYLMGGLSLLGLSAVFFFIRNAFVNYLVGSFKRSPNTAGLAGWGLFGGLLFGSAIGSIALVGKSYLTMPVIVSLGTLSVTCFLVCALFSRKE